MLPNTSTVILSALRQIGLSDDEIVRATGLSKVALNAVATGKRQFRDAQMAGIEDTTGKTIGQLGAMVLEPEGGEFTDLMDSGAKFAQHCRLAESAANNGAHSLATGAGNKRDTGKKTRRKKREVA